VSPLQERYFQHIFNKNKNKYKIVCFYQHCKHCLLLTGNTAHEYNSIHYKSCFIWTVNELSGNRSQRVLAVHVIQYKCHGLSVIFHRLEYELSHLHHTFVINVSWYVLPCGFVLNSLTQLTLIQPLKLHRTSEYITNVLHMYTL